MTNDERFMNYRLADLVKGYCSNSKEMEEINYLKYIKKKLPNSIGVIYLGRAKLNKNNELELNDENFKILLDILSKQKYKKPKENEIIMHLRIGDGILNYKNNKFVYRKLDNNYYTYPLEIIEKTLKKNKEIIKNKNLIVNYAAHNKYNLNLSKIYLQKFEEILKKNNIKYKLVNGKNPDEDLCYMSSAKIFIKSGGGFSKLISDIVKFKGNKVIEHE